MTQDYMKQAERRISVARSFIIRRLPVVASAMARTEIVYRQSTGPGQMPLAATDCHRTIWVDARRIAQLTDLQAVFLITHEVLHKMLGHAHRSNPSRTDGLAPAMVKQLTNVAQDFIINKMVADMLRPLVAAGLPAMFPPSDTMSGEPIETTRDNFWQSMAVAGALKRPMRLMDPTVGPKDSAEAVYTFLLDTRPQQDSEPDGGEPETDGEGREDGDTGSGGQEGPPQRPGKDGKPGEGDPGKRKGGADDGDAGAGEPSPEQQMLAALAGREGGDDSTVAPAPDAKTGAVPTQGDLDAEQAITTQLVAVAAEKAAKQAGSAAGWFNRLMEANRRPAINPRTLLERYVRRRTARSDYSLRRLRRTGMHFGMALPTLRSEEVGDLIVAIDTSGSVTDTELSQYASDIAAVQRVMKPASTRVIYCDTRVAGEQVFRRNQKLKLEPKGGGGTKIIPVFQHVKKAKIEGDLILYLTDGYVAGHLPRDLKPKAPVVWLVYDGNKDFKPDFGDVVHTKAQKSNRAR